MNKNITNYNHKGQCHGYQEWYYMRTIMKLWYRGNMKNGNFIGYTEDHHIKRIHFHLL